MASQFPSIIASLPYPTANQRLSSPSHSGLHGSENDEIIQLETFIGTQSSMLGTLMYDIRAASSGGGGHVQTANLGGTGQTSFTKGDILVAQSSSVLSKLAVGVDGLALVADSTKASGARWGSAGKFGGTGTDGPLSIASGTTTIDLANAQVVTKNYTSISITGGNLAFINPNALGTTVFLRSQGDVTITSGTVPAIDGRGIGAAGAPPSSGTGSNSWAYIFTAAYPGGVGNSGGTGGAGGLAYSNPNIYFTNSVQLINRSIYLSPGSGGGSGGQSASGSAGGAGGNGGGALMIECAGSLNFTGTIDVSGAAGLIGGSGSGSGRGGGGGGGGSAGMCVILYNGLTANTGTVTASGGAGGQGGPGSSASGGQGGAGGAGSLNFVGGAGGSLNTAGSAGTGAGAGGGGGGGSASGTPTSGGAGGAGSLSSIVTLNTIYS